MTTTLRAGTDNSDPAGSRLWTTPDQHDLWTRAGPDQDVKWWLRSPLWSMNMTRVTA